VKLEDIHNKWAKDSQFDKTELGDEALRIAKLIAEWIEIRSHEKGVLRRLKGEMDVLKRQLHIFYTEGPSKEQIDAGWELPPRGKILRDDLKVYIPGDPRMIALSLKLGLQEEKVSDIEDYIKHLHQRHWAVKYAIDWTKFTHGG
jgi:hypothetical protein